MDYRLINTYLENPKFNNRCAHNTKNDKNVLCSCDKFCTMIQNALDNNFDIDLSKLQSFIQKLFVNGNCAFYNNKVCTTTINNIFKKYPQLLNISLLEMMFCSGVYCNCYTDI